MSVYPQEFDSDSTIQRVDDNLSEIAGDVINQCRAALFAIEIELGLIPSGSKDSVADRLNISLNADGTIKASALTSIGLVTLPINNSQIGTFAGIRESKLTLDYSTSSLHTLIQANSTLLTSLSEFATNTDTTLNSHIGGSATSSLRHVASHIDLNATPSDIRDNTYTWSGLLDKDGYTRTADNVADALLQINNALVLHENETNTAHEASAIGVDTSNFIELSKASTNLQQVLNNIDDIEELNLGIHRATEHVSGIPKDARSISFINPDGYSSAVVNSSPATAHVIHSPPGTIPVDSVSVGDNVVVFNPDNSNFLFDTQFSQVNVGDIIRINYGNGIEDIRKIDSIRFSPGVEWAVRINGTNLRDTDGYAAYARIDKPLYDKNTFGVLSVAAANATPLASFSNILGGVIVADPRGACAVGIDFNSSQINENHYNLYLELYPSGDPTNHVISLPAVDVSGNLGITPGKYTLANVVQNINNKFREIGFNFRFVAFEVEGNLGIMMSDSIDGAAFSIVSGNNSGGSLIEGIYIQNIIGNASADNWDALGFGSSKADLAGPAYQATFSDSTSALLPTKVIHPLKRRSYIVNGKVYDNFKNKNGSTLDSNGYGYYPAEIIARTVTGTTIEVTYRIAGLLRDAGLKIGKTIVIQPSVDFGDVSYSDNDYGRFIIKEASFSNCSCDDDQTTITVINGIHGFGGGVGYSSPPGLAVRLYISEDSVSFNDDNLIDSFPSGTNYHRNFEIYIADNKTTFSHERSRLPVQSETTELLVTDNWHINFVSDKLRGYKDSTLSSFNKYIRFYILSYDSASGEFDGYIGKRIASTNNVQKTGPITTGRKNTITRFYDETNVDYIDLEFVEPSTTDPGLLILGSAVPRYVDIELFPSLTDDDELLKLATCEVNWHPTVGKNIVERVIDCRQRGSISETEFTKSAVDFITAVPRSLNQNGVIRGFDFVGENTNAPGELFYNGGIALINGKIFTINNGSCVIPQLTNTSTPPQIIDWLVCLNDLGNFISIPLTPVKDQFFARNNITPGTNYYIPSLTFSELVGRKDLCLVSVVTATINSISVEVKDARNFVSNESQNIPFTWVSDTDEKDVGNFRSFESLMVWLENFGNKKSYVKVRGDFTYTTPIDFSELNGSLIFEGENATFNFTSNNGFIIGSNTTIKNIKFNYNPSFSGSNIINSGNGCLFSDLSDINSLINVNIENCSFNSTVSDRPPFINFMLINETYIDGLTIERCSFSDTQAIFNSAIAIVNNFVGSSQIYSGIISNVLINNNRCDGYQNVSLVSVGAPGIFVNNVNVTNNSFGYIFYATESSTKINPNINGPYNSSLNIINNTCMSIVGPILSDGTFGSFTASSGNVSIFNNYCSYIRSYSTNNSGKSGNVNICNNYLKSSTYQTYMVDILNDSHNAIAIFVGGNDDSNVIISNNNISKHDLYDQVYRIGIACGPSANISGNTICNFSIYGIFFGTNIFSNFNINSNNIYRESTDISAYITGTGISSADITGNFFDSQTINDTDGYVVVIPDNSNWVVERNKNQVVNFMIGGLCGQVTSAQFEIGSGDTGAAGDLAPEVSKLSILRNGYVNSLHSFGAAITAQMGTFAHQVRWDVDLKNLLPFGVKILSVTLNVSTDFASASGVLLLNINRRTVNNTDYTSSFTTATDSILPVTKMIIDTSDDNFYNYSSDAFNILSIATGLPSGADGNLNLSPFIVSYTW